MAGDGGKIQVTAGKVAVSALCAAVLASVAPAALATEASPPAGPPAAAPAATAPNDTAPGVVRYAVHRPPGFLAMHGSAGVLDPIGAYGSVDGGDDVLKANDIDDPAVKMARSVAARLAAARHAPVMDAPLLADQKEAEAIFYQATDGQDDPRGLLVDVATIAWGVLYYAGDSRHYYLDYRARLQVIDLAAGAVLLHADCEHHGDKAADAFTWDEVAGDSPRSLKARIGAEVDECLAQFRASADF